MDDLSAKNSPARALSEELARRLGIAAGRTRLELEFHDGRLERAYTHQKLSATSLGDEQERGADDGMAR